MVHMWQEHMHKPDHINVYESEWTVEMWLDFVWLVQMKARLL